MQPASRCAMVQKKHPVLYGVFFQRAEDEIRTRDPHLGKVMLYQLSYFRLSLPAAQVACKSYPVFSGVQK